MTGVYLGIGILLLIANGFFVGAEFALIAARRTKIERMAAEGNKRAGWAFKAIKDLSVMLAGSQLGITMASLGLGHVAEPAVARVLESALLNVAAIPAGLTHTIAFVLALAIVVFLHMVVGEMAPKNIAIAQPERSVMWLIGPFRVFVFLLRPFIRFINELANLGLRAFKVEPKDELIAAHSTRELGFMIEDAADEGFLRQYERRLLTGAVGFSDLDAGAVMVPRVQTVAIPLRSTPAEIEKVVLETGHSRLPVFGEDLDDVVGFLHSKDLLKVEAAERDEPLPRRLLRDIMEVPESQPLQPVLLEMRKRRQHLALVVEEHGGTAGIVTLEDVLEELVGEIRDEHDRDEAGLQRLAGGRTAVPGDFRLDEVEDALGLKLPEGDYETVAGFIMHRLGRVPRRRDAVRQEGWELRVLSMHRRRVVQVLIEQRPD